MRIPVLDPVSSVQALSLVCAFMLRTTVAYGISAMLARVATSAALRFLVWLGFLLGTATYWIYGLTRLFCELQRATVSVAPHSALVALPPVLLTGRMISYLGMLLTAAGALYSGLLVSAIGIGLWRRLQIARVLRHRIEAPGFLSEVINEARARMSGPDCSIWLLPGLRSPATLGCLNPGIYLPFEEARPDNDLGDVLRHEYAHLRRRDYLWEQLAICCRWIVVFHPLTHRALSSMRLERELACDVAVVRENPMKRAAYADTLVRFGWKELTDDSGQVGIGLTSSQSSLSLRVGLILAEERVYSKWSRAVRVLFSSGACWFYAALAPALWIVFTLPSPSLQKTASLPVTISTHKRPHRKAALSAKKAAASKDSAPTLTLATAETPYTSSEPERRPVYHIQNADEPMSNPVVPDEAEGPDSSQQRLPTYGPLPGSRQPSRSTMPSISVSSPTMPAVSPGSGGRGHDRD